ncbi:MAG: CHASE2 domain-containing protein, partial [Proteobacteria bacterium]|nr:CHASE2 domain-containing protein [Pseudomonadota bacterium]
NGLSSRVIVLTCLIWIFVGISGGMTQVGDYLESKIASPINFGIRSKFGMNPKQHSRLKILALDDKAFAYLGAPMPDLKLWGDLLDGIAESKPKLIVIDAMFSNRPSETEQQLKYYFSRLESLGVPIALGSFVNSNSLQFKDPLDMSESWYSIKTYLPDASVFTEGRGVESHIPAFRIREPLVAYGPAKELKPWFNRVGHFQLLQDHKIEPFLRISVDKVLPHITMFAADKVHFENGNLRIDNKRVALDRGGAIEVNFVPTDSWKIKSLVETIRDVRDGYAPAGINQNDIVLILPLYFTGNTDFRPSPFGLMPGGLYLAAMLNSVLSGDWLQPILASEIFTVILIALAGLLIIFLSTAQYWTFIGFTLLATFVLSQILFSVAGLVFPWFHPLLFFTCCSVHLFALKMRANERKVMTLRAALDGAVDPTQLEGILKKPENVNLEPRERVVTLMFIDVVGFSLVAENLLPRIAFDCLKKVLGDMSEIVHKYGGVVDKSLGDGLLCYFGYRFDSDLAVSDHAEHAVRCAIEIQEYNIKQTEEYQRTGQPLFPLRIGINTSSCFLGDLGSDSRIEFTVVGNGVNFAKRLEGACTMNSILVGATTWELVKGIDINQEGVSKKLIRIKHHRELVDAFEYDPLFDRPLLRQEIRDNFRKSANLQRLSERIQIRDQGAIKVSTDNGDATVVNFSGTGISLMMRMPVPKGTCVKISLDSQDGQLAKRLLAAEISDLDAEVRWNYQAPAGFIHGLAFLSVEEEKAEEFISIMCDFAFVGGTNPILNSEEDQDDHKAS